jgi:hypothetical protein
VGVLREALREAVGILGELIKELRETGEFDIIEERVAECMRRYDEFIQRFPFNARPEAIDALKPEDLYNPPAKDHFFYYVDYKLQYWAGLPATSDYRWSSARENIDAVKRLLKKIVDPSVRISSKVDAEEAEEIPYWGGGDRLIVKKLVSLYNPDKVVPILSTNIMGKVVEGLGIGSLVEGASKGMFNRGYEGLSVGEKFEVFSKVMIDIKDAIPELKDRSNVFLAKVLLKLPGVRTKPVFIRWMAKQSKPLLPSLLLFEPRYEVEVIALFSKYHEKLGFPYVVSLNPAQFPDAELIDGKGNFVHAEFELKASDFERHDHDPEDVDYIICWEDDLPEGHALKKKVKALKDVLKPQGA